MRKSQNNRLKLPPEIESAASRFLEEMNQYRACFVRDRRLKRRLARRIADELPPQPGRPGFPAVTEAIELRDKLQAANPRKSAKWVWRKVYRQLIPGHRTMPLIERRMAENRLRRQVRWREYAQKRQRRKTAAKNSQATG
jgi:hypothetical protein